MADKKRFALAYIILRFPKRSEKFIEREVTAMAELLGSVLVFSLRKGEFNFPRNPNVEIMYLKDQSLWRAVRAHGYLLAHSPRRFIRTLWKYILLPYARVLKPKNSRERRKRTAKRTRLYLKSAIIASEIIKKKVPHIHAHYAHHPAQTAFRIANFTDRPFSFTAHAKDLFLAKPSKLRNLVKKSAFALTCTRDGERFLKSQCSSKYEPKIHCLYHGLPLSRFFPLAEKQPKKDESAKTPVILSAGRFINKKGFDVLLLSLSLLKKRGLNFKCILAGDGRLVDEINGLVDSLGLRQEVEFPGFLPEEDLAELYRQASLFALACRISSDGNRDGIPNVILEAMASGLPVVSTAVGGVPEVVKHEENGFLIEPDAPEAFADALESLIKGNDLRKRMGEKGRQLVCQQFEIKNNSEKLLRLFLKRSEKLRLFCDDLGRNIHWS